MSDLLSDLDTSIRNLDARLRELAASPRFRGCYDVLLPGDVVVVPGFSDVGFVKFPDGTIQLSGTIFPFSGGTLFTLPPKNRPAACTLYPIAYGGTVQICPDGAVNIIDPPNIILDLVHQEFAPTAGTSSVTMTENPQDDVLFVERNGIVQSTNAGHYIRIGSTITFSDPFVANERVVVCWSPIVTAPGVPMREEFSPTPTATSVTMAREALRFANVSRNGIAQSTNGGDYTVFGNSLVFSTEFVAAERVVVSYAALPSYYGRPEHYETTPSASATQITLPKTPARVLKVARNGVIQSEADGNFSQAANVLTFSDPFVTGERVVIGYVSTSIAGVSIDSISFRAGA